MVKEKNLEIPDICLDHRKPCARTYEPLDIFEQVTVPDVAPSLYQMVTTATVGSMPGNSVLYQYPDLGDDDDAHDHPDYEKLDKLDIVEKEAYAENFLNNPKNYEKKDVSDKTETEGEGTEKGEGSEIKKEGE